MIRVVPLDASLGPAWAALFEASSSACYCRYWHFSGSKNDWLARCAMSSETSRDEQAAALGSGDPSASGLVALDGDRVVGWMKLAPRAAVPKLRRLPVYRARDLGDDAGVFSVGCFLVDPAFRARGVASALVAAAPDFVRARGGRVIEAYPRRTSEPMHPEEALMGPERLFVANGFTPHVGADDIDAYPVYRRLV